MSIINNLIIRGIPEYIEITAFKLRWLPGQHAKCSVSFSVHEEIPSVFFNEQVLSIIAQMEDGTQEILIQGIVSQFDQKIEGDQIEAKLVLSSASIKLDFAEQTVPYQNIDQSYKNLVKQILERHPQSDVLFHTRDKENQRIGDVLIQYEETDWKFCKRLASHLNSILIPEIKTGRPNFYVGIPQDTLAEWAFTDYTVSVDKRYYQRKDEQKDKSRFLYYQVTTAEYYPIGTEFRVQGRRLSILSLCAELIKGKVIFNYEIGYPELYESNRYVNTRLTGASLKATVINTDSGTVRVCFDTHPLEENIIKNYPWTPVMGNLFSCLPETGEKVSILFKTAEESQSIAIETFRANDIQACGEITSSADRYFTTSERKSMSLIPDSISLDGHTGNSLTMNDNDGLIFTGKKAEITANGKIVIQGDKINAFSPLQTTLLKGKTGGGSINICQDFNTSGPIKMTAQSSSYMEMEPLRTERPNITDMEQKAIGMIPTGISKDKTINQALGMITHNYIDIRGANDE